MDKIAFTMKLKAGFKDEYKRRHDNIWPELEILLKEAGISDYSIFLDEKSNTLFAVQKSSGDDSAMDLSTREIVKKWWFYMADIMETNPDYSPLIKPLELVFHMD